MVPFERFGPSRHLPSFLLSPQTTTIEAPSQFHLPPQPQLLKHLLLGSSRSLSLFLSALPFLLRRFTAFSVFLSPSHLILHLLLATIAHLPFNLSPCSSADMSTMDYEKKDHREEQQLENVMSNDTDLKHQHQPLGGVDDEVAKYINSGVVIGEAENKRVLKLVSSACPEHLGGTRRAGHRTRAEPLFSPLPSAQSTSSPHHGHHLLLPNS